MTLSDDPKTWREAWYKSWAQQKIADFKEWKLAHPINKNTKRADTGRPKNG